jgi:acetyltransferase-like isoleucine patch superfamily enzyme
MLRKIINYVNTNSYIFFRKKEFKKCGKNVKIVNPLKIDGIGNISLHDNVIVNYKSWLAAIPLSGDKCILEIGEGCAIGHFNHIYATREIIIERKVLTADKVYISDNVHNYSNPFIPIIDQGVKQLKSVRIGEGTWIGENVCVIGANIGKNCVIGANAVVTKDIPDYCIAVGIPAKVIKIYNFKFKKWRKI